MPVSKITWGAAYAKTIVFEYPLHAVTTDREPREGSEWATSPGGTREAWIVGKDYVIECEVIAIRNASGTYTAISGADKWQDFLDWCRGANPLRFYPDVGSGTYIDNCYLVEPMRGFGQMDGSLGRTVKIKIANALYDFHQALMGSLYGGP